MAEQLGLDAKIFEDDSQQNLRHFLWWKNRRNTQFNNLFYRSTGFLFLQPRVGLEKW